MIADTELSILVTFLFPLVELLGTCAEAARSDTGADGILLFDGVIAPTSFAA